MACTTKSPDGPESVGKRSIVSYPWLKQAMCHSIKKNILRRLRCFIMTEDGVKNKMPINVKFFCQDSTLIHTYYNYCQSIVNVDLQAI